MMRPQAAATPTCTLLFMERRGLSVLSEAARWSRPVRSSGVLCALRPTPIARSGIPFHAAGLEGNPCLGQHVGLLRVLGLIRMDHAEHPTRQQWLQVVTTEEGSVRQTQFTHDLCHGTRYIAECHDFPPCIVEQTGYRCLVSDQAPRWSGSLCSGQVLLLRPSLVSDQPPRFETFLTSDQARCSGASQVTGLVSLPEAFPEMLGDPEHRDFGAPPGVK